MKPRRPRGDSQDESIGLLCTMHDVAPRKGAVPVGEAAGSRVSAEMKVLFSDFTVREVPAAGDKPLRLTSLAVSASCVDPQTTKAAKSAEQLSESEVALAFEQLVSPPEVVAIVGLATRGDICDVTISAIGDKSKRALIHAAVRKLGSEFSSSTGADGQIMVHRGKTPAQWKRRSEWPASRPDFLHFTLYKENIDSNSALRLLGKKLGMPVKAFQFCGTKDKRAVTLQRVACYHVTAEKVVAMNGRDVRFGRNACVLVGDFAYEKAGLSLGHLAGNHFSIILRSLSRRVPLAELQEHCERLQRIGFINFFGPQRFGTTSVLTSDIGLSILSGDYSRCVELLLHSKAEFVPEMQQAVAILEKGKQGAAAVDWNAVLEVTPPYCLQERDMLHSLVEYPNDYERALLRLPRTLLMLYCHSVQSLVWNMMVSRRLQAYGPTIVTGDLVCLTEVDEAVAEVEVPEADVNADKGASPTPEAEKTDPTPDSSTAASPLPCAHLVTDEDVACGRFDITSLVLPLPGPDSLLQYPATAMCTKAEYEVLLKSLGALPLLTASAHLTKQFHFHGAYRKAVVRPSNMHMRSLWHERGPDTARSH